MTGEGELLLTMGQGALWICKTVACTALRTVGFLPFTRSIPATLFSGPVWTFIPPGLKDGHRWRDSLEHLLFMENGMIGFFDFSGQVPVFVDSGWKVSDFVHIPLVTHS